MVIQIRHELQLHELVDHNYRKAGHFFLFHFIAFVKKSKQYFILCFKFAGIALTNNLHFKRFDNF